MARYVIDPDRSKVWIDARSSLHPIHAETTGVEGWADFEVQGGGRLDLATAPAAHLELPVELLSSGNSLYDREMRRRIDARRYPSIRGDLTEIKETEEDGHYRVRGDITFRGVTRSVENELVITSIDERTLRLEGAADFDIRDFGMEPPKILTLKVYPEVGVRIELLAARD